MKVLRTISGSTYELDEAGKRIRRVYGIHHADRPLRRDGVWESYSDVEYGLRRCCYVELVGYDDPEEGPLEVLTTEVTSVEDAP